MAGLDHASGSRLHGTAPRSLLVKLLHTDLWKWSGSLNALLHGFKHSLRIPRCGLGGRRFTNFSNFNPHNCRASINSDYTDQVVKWLSQSSDALKNDPHNGDRVLLLLPKVLQARKDLGCCVYTCACREDSVLSDRTFPLL